MRFHTMVLALWALICAGLGPAAAHEWQITSAPQAGKCVALTFDDGPDVDLTPGLLATLKVKGAVATFFLVGQRVKMWPDIVRAEYLAGDEVGNHSWSHPVFPRLSNAKVLSQISRTDDAIKDAIGVDPTLVRMPYGSISSRVAGLLAGREIIGWDVDTLDWLHHSVVWITRAAVSDARDGSIILMHDIHPKTVASVAGIIDGLRARGFSFVTVSQLLSGGCTQVGQRWVPKPQSVAKAG